MNNPEIFMLVLFICACCGACLAWWKIKILAFDDEHDKLNKEIKKNNKLVGKERLK